MVCVVCVSQCKGEGMVKKKDVTKKRMLDGIDRVNLLMIEEANEIGLGRKNSLEILSQLRGDNVLFSTRAKLEFREVVRRTIMNNWEAKKARGHIPVGNRKALELKAARLLGISPVSSKRYMDSMRLAKGPFSGTGDDVYLNEFYTKPEEDEYWLDEDADIPSFLEGRR